MRFTMENHRISSPYLITVFHFRTSSKMCILNGPQLPHRPGPVCQTQKVAPEVAETWHRGGVEFIGVLQMAGDLDFFGHCLIMFDSCLIYSSSNV